ncbi:hypothetical protein [Acrocarpospora macrocephala]|nr:hypothetical protein [Acrocarpospora macrocephala]
MPLSTDGSLGLSPQADLSATRAPWRKHFLHPGHHQDGNDPQHASRKEQSPAAHTGPASDAARPIAGGAREGACSHESTSDVRRATEHTRADEISPNPDAARPAAGHTGEGATTCPYEPTPGERRAIESTYADAYLPAIDVGLREPPAGSADESRQRERSPVHTQIRAVHPPTGAKPPDAGNRLAEFSAHLERSAYCGPTHTLGDANAFGTPHAGTLEARPAPGSREQATSPQTVPAHNHADVVQPGAPAASPVPGYGNHNDNANTIRRRT